MGPDPIAISHLTEVEFFSALSKKVRTGRLTSQMAEMINIKFSEHVDSDMFNLLFPNVKHYRIASNWLQGFNTPLRALDAIHLAISYEENMPLVTADRQLHDSAEKIGIESTLLQE